MTESDNYTQPPSGRNTGGRDDTEVFPRMNEDPVMIRTIEFGAPTVTDNYSRNPGRFRYGAAQSSSYAEKEGYEQYWIKLDDSDELIKQIGRNTNWQSGPAANNAAADHVSEHAGYWCGPGTEGCDWQNYEGMGDSHIPITMSLTRGKRYEKLKQEGRFRDKVELWTEDDDIQIIR